MKYPQLVSMPSAVQDWLDEQLEARGIDAVVYTRYILSLLQRDSLDLPDDLLVLSPTKGKKCGIEKLVDELCAKLKEIQSEGESSIHLELSQASVPNKQPHTPSPEDQAQKYYAAFPPLNSKFAESSNSLITLIPEPSSAWSGKKVLANSVGKNKTCNTLVQEASSREEKILCSTTCWGEENKENRNKNNCLWKEVGRETMKSSNQVKEKAKGKKELGYGFAWNMADERNESFGNFCPGGSSENSNSELLVQERFIRSKGAVVKEVQPYQTNVWDSAVCRRLYERRADDGGNIFSVDPVEEEGLQNSCHAETESILHCSSPDQGIDDRNLAQLIAKFDHSIEALWNPDDAPSPDNFSSDGTADCDQELPLDFQQLLSSPSENFLSVELYNMNGKRNANVISMNNSFIQCGTNITSSIWSDQPSQENSIEQEDFGMDYAPGEELNNSGNFENTKLKLSVTSNDSEIDENKFAVLLVGNGKVVGNKFSNSEVHSKTSEIETKDQSSSLLPNSNVEETEKCCTEEKTKITWNKYDNFPSFFTSLPWALNYTLGDITQGVGTGKWSNIGSSCLQGTLSSGNVQVNDYGQVNNSLGNQLKNCAAVGLSDSLNTLNHNKEDSSFTEVIPKQNSFSGLLRDELDSGSGQQKVNASAEHDCHMEIKDCGECKAGVSEDKEEEDLLTSTRTHFRPIRMESMDSQHSTNTGSSNNNNVGCYADGTTFVIPTSLEEVAFRRSESGALYLETEADAGLETPNKYMEYKEKEVYGGRHRYDEKLGSTYDNLREFIPKFKVRQNEKCCQTEEADNMLQSDEEIDTKRSRQECKTANNPDDFYFPDDDHFAEKIINSLEESSEISSNIESKSESTNIIWTQKNLNLTSRKYNWSSQYESRIGNAPKGLKYSSCKCDSNHLETWKTGWPKSPQITEPGVWELSGIGKSESWYNIWKSSPGPSRHRCEHSPLNVQEPESFLDKGPGNDRETKSMHYSRLREELTMEGEQLLSDLSYMQHLYQGSDWQDDTTPGDESGPDWRPNQEETDGDGKFRCLSPAEDSTQEMMMYAEDAGCTRSLPSPIVEHQLALKETKSVDDFDASCPASTFRRRALLSTELETEWKQNERPFNAKAIQKDRKRRHSASQRACSYYLEGICRRPHCRFSHDLATVPCRFWADSSCLKGIACPFLHGSSQALRPVTL